MKLTEFPLAVGGCRDSRQCSELPVDPTHLATLGSEIERESFLSNNKTGGLVELTFSTSDTVWVLSSSDQHSQRL